MFSFKKLKRKKQLKQEIDNVLETQQTTKEDNIFSFYNRASFDEKKDLANSHKKIMTELKRLQPDLINNSNVDLITQSLTCRSRDLYAFAGNNSLHYLTYLIQHESVVPINLYEYHLELLVKNESIARRIVELPIQKTFSNYFIKNNNYYEWKIDLQNLSFIFENIYYDLLKAIELAEVYGGVYIVCSSDGLLIYQLSQFTQRETLLSSKDTNDYSDLYKLNTMLNKRLFNVNWLKEKKCDYLEFSDGSKYPYNRVYLLKGSKQSIGVFTDKELNGISQSVFEGNLHHLVALIENIEALNKQLSIQNRLVFKVKDYQTATAYASRRELNNINEAMQKIVSTRSSDGFITDVENDISMLNSQVNIVEIVEKAILKMTSFIYNIPLTWLTGETNKTYINTETEKSSKEIIEITSNILVKNYRKIIQDIFYNYLLLVGNEEEKTKINIITGEKQLLKINDFLLNYK